VLKYTSRDESKELQKGFQEEEHASHGMHYNEKEGEPK
jgi:hypothetical protein